MESSRIEFAVKKGTYFRKISEVNVRLHELLFGKLARRDNSELEDLFPYIDFVNEPGSALGGPRPTFEKQDHCRGEQPFTTERSC